MTLQPAFCAAIPPVPEGATRPLWSVMIPTYNCADYLRETLASVLSQDPGPEVMQIEVIDDCSTKDDPAAVVAELGAGRVGFFRQPRNVGHVANFNTCLQRARGELVHLLHGDDRVRPGFYQALGSAFLQDPEIGAAFSRAMYMAPDGNLQVLSPLERDAPGILEGWLERLASGQRVATPSVVARRAVYEHLGGFDSRFRSAGEDWEMWVRIAAHYAVWYEPQPLAEYRVRRTGSLTESERGTSQVVRDMRHATEIIQAYLSDHLARPRARLCIRQARDLYASWALNHAESLVPTYGLAGAIDQLKEALRCSRRQWVLRRVLRLTLYGAAVQMRNVIRPQRSG